MTTADFLRQHPYLIADAIGLLSVGAAWTLAGPQRRMLLLSGAMFVPFFPIAALFSDGAYWAPSHVDVGFISPIHLLGGSAGIEDMLFLFIAGARAWFFATLLDRSRWTATASPAAFARDALGLTLAALGALATLRLCGVGYTPASYVIPTAIGAVLLWLRPALWPLALSSAIGSTLLAGIELRLWFTLWPQWRAAWTPGTATSLDVFGAKLGDVVWWIIVGAVHPLAVARCAGVARGPARRRTGRWSETP